MMKNKAILFVLGTLGLQNLSMDAHAQIVRSKAQFPELLKCEPLSVVVFHDASTGSRKVPVIFEKASRNQRYKDAHLKFFIVDTNRPDVAELCQRYHIEGDLPHVQIFIRDHLKPQASMNCSFSLADLRSFIERYIGAEITNEINTRKIRKQFALAQAKRPYYAADYYNPFYMMPWYNYSPPSDWPDQGPEWVGIEIE